MSIVHATATFSPRGDLGRFVSARVTPGVRKSVEAATQLVYQESQSLVPVDTGELKASGKTVITESEKTVTGHVLYDAPHSMFLEYGTGIAGAASAGAGPWNYSASWPGMPAQPYLRPALDTAREAIKGIFRSQIAVEMHE